MKFIEIDVRELEPPMPMTNILSALSTLSTDRTEGLLVHHSRQPFPLFAKLKEAGWDYECEQKDEHYFVISIFPQPAACQ